MQAKIQILRKEAEKELVDSILPYWMHKMKDEEFGGFFGRITGKEKIIADAPKGAVLNARILWTYAAAYRIFGKAKYLQTATRARNYLLNRFYDNEQGGIYWLLDYKGNPLETKKQIYAQGFAIYGLSEFYRATSDEESLVLAQKLFHDIEKHSFDSRENGYLEAFTRDWQLIEDMRLSEKDANEQKTMNTHLHILEPYTNLYRVWKNDFLKQQLKNLTEIFLNKIIDSQTNHLNLFFDNNWNNKSDIISYGHDIEASWLLHEAAVVLGDNDLLKTVEKAIPRIVRASEDGLLPDGSMAYEKNIAFNRADTERHWWVQAETVIGFLNHYQHYNDEKSLQHALACWNYIKHNLTDRENGEWFWSVYPDGTVNRDDDKAGIWKCPYHNGRMCMEIIERFSSKN